VAEQIATQFAATDMSSAQAQQQVQSMINTAMLEANRTLALGNGKNGAV
jgi:phosphoheptose isomerase